MRVALKEIGLTLRYLFRSPGSTFVAFLILTLGLTVTIYMFSAINAYILRPLPFAESEKLIHMERMSPEDDSVEVTLHDFVDWRAAQTSFDSLAAFYPGTINLSGQDRPERFDGAFVTSNVLRELRVKPHLGRTFLPGEDQPGAAPVVILSFNVWRNRFDADSHILGKTIRVNAKEAVIVGVMPPDFHFPVFEDVWVPMSLDTSNVKRGEGMTVEVFGRLKKGVTLEQAQAEFRAISERLAKLYPDTNKNLLASLKPYAWEYVSEETRKVLWTMFACVVLILLIACANVANLTLVRMIGRTREFAIRSALGAGRWRIVVQVLLECVLISVMASIAAGFLADYSIGLTFDILRTQPDMTPPFWIKADIDWRLVTFTMALAMITAILAGLIPALRASRADLNAALHQGGWGMAQPLGRSSRILVISQIAFSIVLLTCAGLMTRSILKLDEVNVGANVSNLLTGRIALFETKYPDLNSRIQFFDALQQKLSSIPSVKSATLGGSLPGAFTPYEYYSVEAQKDPEQRQLAFEVAIIPNYFETLEIPLLQGRGFDARDHQSAQKVAIVNQMFIEKHWPGKNPIGERIRLGEGQQGEWLTIIGVVGNVQQAELEDERMPAIYLPLAQTDTRFMSILMRTEGDPILLADQLRKSVQELDPDLPVYWVRSLEQFIDMNRFDSNFMATLFGIFAAVALVLAAGGQYAVLAYTIGQRTREIGVRRALGALDQTILKLFLHQGLRQFAFAFAFGLPLAILFGRLLSGQFYGVSWHDPLTLFVVPVSLFLVCCAAAIFPAKRALRIDPSIALRSE